MLHVAPEFFFTTRFKKIKKLDYVSVDLKDPRAMLKMDITSIRFPSNHFDAIYCSHVLEHIPEDRKALRELYRVCKPMGWALIQVPITAERTFEDPSITKPEDRKRVFGLEDHVRCCGLDYAERIQEAGFRVRVVSAGEMLMTDEFDRMGVLHRDRYVFYCVKFSKESIAGSNSDGLDRKLQNSVSPALS